jgi:integrase
MTAARGMGWIYQRGLVWYIGYHFRGERVRESSHSTRRGDAVKLLRKRQAEMGKGRLIGPDAERTTFEDLAQMVRNDYRINDRKSVGRMEQAITKLEDWFGASRAVDITTDQVSVFIRSRLEGQPGPGRFVRERRERAEAGRRRTPRPDRPAQPATIRYELSILKRMCHLAVIAERLDHAPHVPSIEVRNTRKGFFEAADLTAVLGHLPDELRPVARFAYLTGWRRGEILLLTWRQVDFNGGVVRLDPGTTKNDEGRAFPFAVLPDLAALLRDLREATARLERETGRIIPWVFHRRGEPIKDFRGVWAKACTAAGCPDRLFHDFRRTAVRNLERAGVSRSVAMKLMGHKTEAVYRRYAIVSESDLAEGVTKLASLHQDGATPRVVGLEAARQAIAATVRPQLAGVKGSGGSDDSG